MADFAVQGMALIESQDQWSSSATRRQEWRQCASLPAELPAQLPDADVECQVVRAERCEPAGWHQSRGKLVQVCDLARRQPNRVDVACFRLLAEPAQQGGLAVAARADQHCVPWCAFTGPKVGQQVAQRRLFALAPREIRR
ncbi:MAG: hypothetical protein OXP36_13040 [Gammaproteobacteria bacterium]|nr:hypothetical protein [Gammaproteobacteria bacterium]